MHQIFFTTKLNKSFNIQNCINEIPGIKTLKDKIFSNLHKLLAISTHFLEIRQKKELDPQEVIINYNRNRVENFH